MTGTGVHYDTSAKLSDKRWTEFGLQGRTRRAHYMARTTGSPMTNIINLLD